MDVDIDLTSVSVMVACLLRHFKEMYQLYSESYSITSHIIFGLESFGCIWHVVDLLIVYNTSFFAVTVTDKAVSETVVSYHIV